MRTPLQRIFVGFGAALLSPLFAQPLHVRITDGQVRVSAPQLHFINGQPLDRLQNGAPVAFAFQLTLSHDRTMVAQRDIRRFIVSYDIWSEKYKVVKAGHPQRSASQLSAAAAESWCIADMAISASSLAQDRPVWAKLEVRAEEPGSSNADAEGPVSLARLIDIFSKRSHGEQSHWTAEAGPLRLGDLARVPK